MAEYQIAANTPATLFNESTGTHQIAGALNEGVIADGNGADNAFETSESLTADFTAGLGGVFSATFRGTVNIGGTDYPVFRINGYDYVVGIQLDSSTYPNFASLGPLDTSPLTVDFCFAPGTQIATPSGFTVVEDLQIGDLILRADGGTTAVKWLGRQTALKCFAGPRMQPVRIRAGALGDGLPHSDLTVTADHGMVFFSSSEAVGKNTADGLVINASALVNGTSIDWVPMAELPDRFTVYHVETEAHEAILANGVASETYLDMPGRMAFDNYQEYLDLYGTEAPIRENPMPRIAAPRLVPKSIRQRIAA